MEVKVKSTFVDKITRERYFPGRTIEIAGDERIKGLVDRGLIEPVKVEKAATDKKPRRKPTTKKQ